MILSSEIDHFKKTQINQVRVLFFREFNANQFALKYKEDENVTKYIPELKYPMDKDNISIRDRSFFFNVKYYNLWIYFRLLTQYMMEKLLNKLQNRGLKD